MNTTLDEMIHPDDLLEAIEIEIAPDAFEGPLMCMECGHEMERVISINTLRGGQIAIEFEQYRCSQCGWERMTLEQARQLQAIQHFFARLSIASPDVSQARVRPLTASAFLVQMG